MKRYFESAANIPSPSLEKKAGLVTDILTDPASYKFVGIPMLLKTAPHIAVKTGLNKKFYASSLNRSKLLRRAARNIDYITRVSVKETPRAAKAVGALVRTPLPLMGMSDYAGGVLVARGAFRRTLPDFIQKRTFKNRQISLPALEETVEKHVDNIKNSLYEIKSKTPGEAFLYGLKNDGKRIILKNKS
jgi:hypothetical protein